MFCASSKITGRRNYVCLLVLPDLGNTELVLPPACQGRREASARDSEAAMAKTRQLPLCAPRTFCSRARVPRDALGPEHLPTPNNADITAVWLLVLSHLSSKRLGLAESRVNHWKVQSIPDRKSQPEARSPAILIEPGFSVLDSCPEPQKPCLEPLSGRMPTRIRRPFAAEIRCIRSKSSVGCSRLMSKPQLPVSCSNRSKTQ